MKAGPHCSQASVIGSMFGHLDNLCQPTLYCCSVKTHPLAKCWPRCFDRKWRRHGSISIGIRAALTGGCYQLLMTFQVLEGCRTNSDVVK